MLTTHGSMVELEEKALAESDDCYIFTGYASVFNNVDQGGDVMMPGAFKKSLEKHGLPLLLYQHEMKEIVGAVVDAKEDKKGLWVKGELPKDDDFVRGRLVPQLKRRALKGMSIGYKAQDTERRKSDNARLLKQVRLFEASFVSLPMNELATVETIKGLVQFADLQIDRDAKSWDAEATMKRLKEKLGDSDEFKSAFLYFDDEKGADLRMLIADVDDNACMRANHLALMKASAVLYGASKGDILPEGAEEAVKSHLDRYFQRLNLESPSKSLSVAEFEALSEGEREARLRGLGVSRQLAKKLLSPNGQRDADRKDAPRDAGLPEDARGLLNALAAIGDIAAAIKRTT